MVENVDTNSEKKEAKLNEVDIRDESNTEEFTNGMYQVLCSELAFLTPCDQAFNAPFLGGKIIELAKFCFKNKRFEPSLSFFSKQVIVSHCV